MSELPCVVCDSGAEPFMRARGIPLLRCTVCGHVFADCVETSTHVESTYGDDYFFGGKDGYPNYLEESSLLENRGRKYAMRLRDYASPGRHLDVGAAAGFIMKGFQSQGWDSTGLEPNGGMVRYGREQLGLNLVQSTLEDCRFERPFDLVTLIQVVAHLNDLKKAFAALRRHTADDGLVLVETWNQASLTARVLGKNWHEYSPPSVLHWFTPERLADALQRYGFERVAQGRMVKWISLRHAMSLSSYAFGGKASRALQDRVPASWRIPYPSEDLFWMLFRATPG